MSDPIADMATRIRNAQMVQRDTTKMPSSKIKVEIAKILEAEGFIAGYEVAGTKTKPELTIKLKSYAGKAVIEEISRISKPGLRQYADVSGMVNAKNGLGILIVSTSKGIMTAASARKLNIGGEVLLMVA